MSEKMPKKRHRSNGFFEQKPLRTMQEGMRAISDDDDVRIAQFYRSEAARRLSPEYISDAAHDFCDVLSVCESLLQKEALTSTAAVVALDTSARLLGVGLHAAISELQTQEGMQENTQLFFVPTVRKVHQIESTDAHLYSLAQQELADFMNDILHSTSGPIIIIDDTLHSGDSLQQATQLLVTAGIALDRVVAVIMQDSILPPVTRESVMPNIPIAIIDPIESVGMSRWTSSPEHADIEAEFYDAGVTKTTDGVVHETHQPPKIDNAYRTFIHAQRTAMEEIGRGAAKEFYTLQKTNE